MENAPVHAGGHNSGNHKKSSLVSRSKLLVISVSALLVVAILTFAGLFIYQSSMGASIDGDKYQAVFLTNGQVYFGKLQALSGGYMKLTDIFYLQSKNSSSENNIQKSESTSTDVQLVKLGNEIHGPKDEMIVSKDQILFFENIKKDGKVAQSISAYKGNK